MQLVVNDSLRGGNPGLALLATGFDHAVQVIDVQQVDAGDLANLGIDITGDRHIDDQEGTAAAPRLKALDQRAIEHVVRSAAGGEDDVHLLDDLFDRVEGDSMAAERLRHLIGSFEGSRGKVDAANPLLAKEPQGDLAHLPGANQQDGPAGEVAEDVGGCRHRGVTDGDRTSPDPGRVARALCRPDRATSDDFEPCVKSTSVACRGQCPLDLAENLGLADHHRIETAGHLEEMRDGLLATELVGIAPPRLEGQRVRPPPKRLEQSIGGGRGGGHRVQLSPVAGRQQHAALDQVVIDEPANALTHTVFGNEHLLPDLDRGGLVRNTDQDELHSLPVPSIAMDAS